MTGFPKASTRLVAMAPVLIPITCLARTDVNGETKRQQRWVNAFQVLVIEEPRVAWAGCLVRVQDGPSARDYHVEETPAMLAPYFGGLPAPATLNGAGTALLEEARR